MELSKYLARYKNLEPPQTSTVKLLIQTIRDECGITLTEKEVALSRGGAVISCHPVVRSELLQYASQVITTLHKKHNIRLSYIR
jgi:hypothetical protein